MAGRYAIERELGRGGSARVFLAHDLRHGRKVALKLLRPELSAMLGGERFLREIQLTATLQHPHILPLYDSGEADGLLYYVMPYVEGESLRARLERERQLPVDDVVGLIRALAAALDFAHRKGVIHRDLKPENILLQDGQPLVADFGIALALATAGGDRVTETGLSLGTPRYMSPEQATGDRALGPQSDVYALGAVAYEMLAGDPPVSGRSKEAILARLLVETPLPIRTVRPTVPTGVEAAVLKALAKVPADRFRTAGEFAAALSAPAPRTTGETVLPTGRRRRNTRVIIPAVSALMLAALAYVAGRWLLRPEEHQSNITRHRLTYSGDVHMTSLSPDGQFLAYAQSAGKGSEATIVIQDLSGGSPDTLPVPGVVNSLEWSPDGTRLLVGVLAGPPVVLPRLGGPGQSLPLPDRYPLSVFSYWLPDGSRISMHSASARRILTMDPASSDTTSIPVPGSYAWLMEGSWAPDGRTFAVATASADSAAWAIRAVDSRGDGRILVEDSVVLASPRWSADGETVYYSRGTDAIHAVAVHSTGNRGGQSIRILVDQLEMLPRAASRPHFALSSDGSRITYARGYQFSNLITIEQGAGDSRPKEARLTSGTAIRWSPVVSADGEWIAFAEQAGDAAEVFRMAYSGGPPIQITFGARVAPQSRIAWSPDGSAIAYVSLRGGPVRVWVADVEGGRVRVLERTRVSLARGHLAWAPGERIAYQTGDHRNLMLVDPKTGDERTLLDDPTSSTGWLFSPRYSPDGRRLAVSWNRTEPNYDFGVWVFDLESGVYAKLNGLGIWPAGWSPDGRYVYTQGPNTPTEIFRIDVTGRQPQKTVLDLPWRQAECSPAGRLHPKAFICAVFEFVSDVWMIQDFD